MHLKDAKETPVQSSTGGYMTGTVSWDYTSGVGGVQWKFVADHTTPAPDVTVRASYLSDYAMKQIYSADTARLMGVSDASKIRGRGWTSAQEADLQKWVKEQVAKDPTKWIAETVTAKTNAEGKYILQFNGTWGTTRNAEVATDEREVGGRYDGSLHKWTEEEVNRLGTVANDPNEGTFNRGLVNYWNRKHINYDWMFVSTDDTDDLRVMTPYNNNFYTSMNSDWGIHSGWSGTGFGVGVTNAVTSVLKSDFVFGINNVKFEITNYDSGANTAIPGDVAETKTTGLPYSKTSEKFRIVWYDQDGKVVKEGKAVQPNATGQIPSEPFDTKDVKKTTEFTAKLYRVDKNGKDQELIAVDSFVVQISNFVLTRYEDFSINNPKPMDNAIYEAEGLPDGLTINPNNGTVSGRPTKAGKYSVKISTTIQDEGADIKGSRDYRALVTDSPLAQGEVGQAYNQEVKPQEIEGYVFKNVTSKFMDGKSIEGLTIENNQITGTPTKEVPATQTTEDGAMGPNVEVTYDIYKLNSKGEEVLMKKGHKDYVPLEITKTASQAPKYEPTYVDKDATPGTEVTTDAPKFLDEKSTEATKPEANPQPKGVKFTLGDGAPQGASVDETTGKVTYKPSANDAGKTVEIPVKVTYSDNTTDEAVAKINVGEAQNKDYQPEYTEADGKAGTEATVTAPNFKDGNGEETQKPDGVKFTLGEGAPTGATINENTGEIKYTPTADQAGTTVRIPVVATYKDGSTDEVVAPIKVAQGDNLNYEPNYKSVIAQVGHEVTVASPEFLDNDGNVVAKKPTVTKYELGEGAKDGVTINETTGEIKYTAVDADKATNIVVPVKVIYADGSVDNTTATIVVPSDADFYTPEANPLETEKGTLPKAEDGIKDKDKLPKGTTYEWETEPDVSKAGETFGRVKITYPDGSTDMVKVPVTVKDNQATKTDVTGTPETVKPNGQQQDTGLTVTNKDDTTPTTVEAKDEDGNTVPVEIGADGKIKVTPPANVDGPIKVTVEDSDLPGGKIEIEIEVEGHKKGQDDNNNGTPTPGTDPSHPGTDDPYIPSPWPNYPGYWYDEPSPDYLKDRENKTETKTEAKAEERELDVFSQYVIGNEDHMFMPNKGITRAEIAQIFARALGYDGYQRNGEYNPYSDLNTNAWYYDAVVTTTEAGVFRGTDKGTFDPNREITKAELIATIARFQELGIKDGNTMNMRPDHWALGEVEAAYQEGWLDIYTKGLVNFDADMVITRAEVVAIFNRAFGRIADIAYIDANADRLTTFKDVNKSDWFYYDVITAANTYANYGMEWLHDSNGLDNEFTNLDDIKWDTKLRNDKEVVETLRRVKFQRNAR